MIILLAILTPIALLDSLLMLPMVSAAIVALLAGQRPTLTASAYVAGKFITRLLPGLLLVLGLDAAVDWLTGRQWALWRDSSALLVALQGILGLLMILYGLRRSRLVPDTVASSGSRFALSDTVTPLRAFYLSAGLTFIKLPGALLYFAAIDQVLRADLAGPGMMLAVLYYNLVLVLPASLIIVAHRLLGARAEPLLDSVSRFLGRWGRTLLLVALFGVGAVLIVDAIAWFMGMPLLPIADPSPG